MGISIRRARRSTALLTVAVAVAAAAIGACSNGSRPVVTEVAPTTAAAPTTSLDEVELVEGGEVVVGLPEALTGFNVLASDQYSVSARSVLRLIWPQAYRVRPDGSFEPSVLAGPALVVSTEPFTVEWRIAAGAVWDDGTPVSSADFAYVWRSCNNRPDEGEPAVVDCADTSGYDQITALEVVDDKTVRAVFARPYAEFEGLFGILPPAHVAAARGADAFSVGFLADAGAAAGPFRVAALTPEQVVLERNPAWWGATPPVLDRIVFRFLPDLDDRLAGIADGSLDLAVEDNPDADLAGRIAGLDDVAAEVVAGPSMEAVVFNTATPVLADPAVRRALAQTIDRRSIVDDLVKPLASAARPLGNRIFPPVLEGYVAHDQDFARALPAEAAAELDAAGWVVGEGGMRARDGVPLALRLAVRDDDPLRTEVVERVAADLRLVGVAVTLDVRPGGDIVQTVFGDPAGWDLAVFALVGLPTPAAFAEQWYGTGQLLNAGAFSLAAVDELLVEAFSAVDPDDRRALLNQVDTLLWEDLPNLPLFARPTVVLVGPRVVGVEPNGTVEGFTWNAEHWQRTAG